jgi:2-polyprenyl-3-methyl-5-hydroxy-6-metoxy-1,4-benzoquinol methylase
MNSEVIKKFYSDLRFPGPYSISDIQFYELEGIYNLYLREIDKNLSDNLSVLDIGCGTGLVSNLFASRYPESQFTAIDFSDSIDYACNFANNHNIKNIKWIKEDFLKYNTDKKFDVIICCGVLHHIPEYQLALEKIKKLLKPNGKLLLALYNPYGKILKKFFRIRYHSKILYEDQENNPYELSFTCNEVKTMCRDLQFISVEPSWNNKFVDAHALFNNQNGGLAIYVFEKN